MSADKRPQLINLPFMIVLLLMISAIFVALVNGRNDFENERFDLPPDVLSEAYMKVFLKAEPGNHSVRLQLAKHYLTIGEWTLARKVLKEGGEELAAMHQAQWLMLQVLVDHYAALPGASTPRLQLKQTISDHIATLDLAHLSTEQIQLLADISLQVGAPDYAATFYAIMAKEDPGNAWRWYAEAGRWSLAADRLEDAAGYYEQAFRSAPDPDTAAMMVDEASRIREFADQGREALAMIQKALERHPQDLRLLARGIALALAQQQPGLAGQWNRRYLEEKPNDVEALARQVDFELQGGEKEQALLYSRRYIRLMPLDEKALRRHVGLAEWNGRYAEALRALKALAQIADDPGLYQHMLRIAQTGYETEAELAVMNILAAAPGLTEKEALRLAARYEYLGYPERADRLLDEFGRHHGRSLTGLRFQADLRERMGDLGLALESRRELSERRDVQPEDRVALARLLFQLGRVEDAHYALKQGLIIDGSETDYTLQLAGELAWQRGDFDMAATAYHHLWSRGFGGDFSRQRMIIANQQLGRAKEVVKRLEENWKRTGDPSDFLAALSTARQAGLWSVVERLLAAADSAPGGLVAEDAYWLIKGDWHSHRQEYRQSFQSYRQALAVNPRSTAAADGALWSLINANDRARLDQWVNAHVRSGLPLTEAYAVALRLLGRDKEALAWYETRLDQHQDDVLWLLDFADLLVLAGRENAAHRVRKHALGVLIEQKEKGADERMVELVAKLQGIPAASRWLATRPGAVGDATILNWWLYRQQYDAARVWLLEQHIERSSLPAWQQLQLALADNDGEAVAALLQGGQIDAGTTDRMAAYTILGRNDMALAEIGRQKDFGAELRAAMVSAAARLPNLWEAGFSTGSIGGLAIQNLEGLYWRTRGTCGWGLYGAASDFGDDDDLLAVAPHRETRLNGSWRRFRDDIWAIDVGYRDGNGGSVFPLGLTYRSSDRRPWQYHLGVKSNSLTAVSGLMRLLGTQDRISAQLDYRIDSRLSFSLSADRHRYESLGGSTLGNGYTLNANVNYRLLGGPNQWMVGGSAAWEDNRVTDQIPDDLQPLLSPDVGPEVLVPETYRDIGLSMTLGRGQLIGNYPMAASFQSASPRWFADLWVGYIEPESTLGVAARAGIGTSLFGGDEFGLTAAYDDRLNKVPGGGASYRIQLYYRFNLGR